MLPETVNLPRLLLQSLAGLVVLAGATIDLYLAVLVQTRRVAPALRAQPLLCRRPFTAFHAQLALFATLLFALPMLFQAPAPESPPQELALILGPLLYAFAGVVVITLCLTYSRASLKQAFLSPHCTAPQAIKKGLIYGLAIIPPIVLLSLLMTSVTEALGYEPQLQEVFDWLGDDSLSLGTRLFLMTAAVVFAPLVEEALFRGILFPALLKGRSFLFAALLSGAYFSLVHIHAPSFLPLLALSVAFSAGYAATGSLLTPIVMHALFNLTSVLFYLADKA